MTSAPKPRQHSAIFSSSVATTTTKESRKMMFGLIQIFRQDKHEKQGEEQIYRKPCPHKLDLANKKPMGFEDRFQTRTKTLYKRINI